MKAALLAKAYKLAHEPVNNTIVGKRPVSAIPFFFYSPSWYPSLPSQSYRKLRLRPRTPTMRTLRVPTKLHNLRILQLQHLLEFPS